MDIDRYTVLGFMAVVVAPVTLVATAVSAMSSDAPKEKPVAAPAVVVSTQVVEESKKVEAPVVVASAPVVAEPKKATASAPRVDPPVVVAKEPIKIKDLYIGMSESDYKTLVARVNASSLERCRQRNKEMNEKFPTLIDSGNRICENSASDLKITIGGVDSQVFPTFENGILKMIDIGWLKDSDGLQYMSAKQAIQSKYELKCSTTEVKNRMNASFDKQFCYYDDGKSRLEITFRNGSIDYSTLIIADKEWNKERSRKANEKINKDI